MPSPESEPAPLSRIELLRLAHSLGVLDADVMTRAELRAAIDEARRPVPRPPEPPTTWVSVARRLLASIVERGLNLPDAAALIRGGPRPPTPKPPPPVATVTLARIYAAQGHLERAIRTLEEVLATEPDHELARELRDQLAARRDSLAGAGTNGDPAGSGASPASEEAPESMAEGSSVGSGAGSNGAGGGGPVALSVAALARAARRALGELATAPEPQAPDVPLGAAPATPDPSDAPGERGAPEPPAPGVHLGAAPAAPEPSDAPGERGAPAFGVAEHAAETAREAAAQRHDADPIAPEPRAEPAGELVAPAFGVAEHAAETAREAAAQRHDAEPGRRDPGGASEPAQRDEGHAPPATRGDEPGELAPHASAGLPDPGGAGPLGAASGAPPEPDLTEPAPAPSPSTLEAAAWAGGTEPAAAPPEADVLLGLPHTGVPPPSHPVNEAALQAGASLPPLTAPFGAEPPLESQPALRPDTTSPAAAPELETEPPATLETPPEPGLSAEPAPPAAPARETPAARGAPPRAASPAEPARAEREVVVPPAPRGGAALGSDLAAGGLPAAQPAPALVLIEAGSRGTYLYWELPAPQRPHWIVVVAHVPATGGRPERCERRFPVQRPRGALRLEGLPRQAAVRARLMDGAAIAAVAGAVRQTRQGLELRQRPHSRCQPEDLARRAEPLLERALPVYWD